MTIGGSRSKNKTKSAQQAQSPLKANSLEAIAKYIKENEIKNAIVMTGAGISTAAGIPDFRSKGTGLYDNLKKFNLPYAEAIFDIDYFKDKPEPFYALAKELYPGKFYPTKTHYFVRLLHDKSILRRNFTQNIDTLERLTGLPNEMIVEAHGSFASASCIECFETADENIVRETASDARVPYCQKNNCKGLVKPDITFFGQSLPDRFYDQLSDFDDTDLLIVIGTSLQVQPFASLIDKVPDHVPRLLINKELAGVHNKPQHGFDFKWKNKKRDVAALGDCDAQVEKLADLLGWKDELEARYTEGHAKLKAEWLSAKENKESGEPKEPEEPKASDEPKEPEEQDSAAKANTEIEALAKELEEKLHIPAEQTEK